MIGPNKSYQQPRENWPSFAMKWLGHFPYVEHSEAPAECAWKLGESAEGFSSDYRRVEAPFRSEIENVINQIADGGTTPASPQVAYFLGIRGEVVQDFLFSLYLSNGSGLHHTIIPFPNQEALSVMRWLMISWFDLLGPDRAALLRLKGTHLKDE
jgi:hypothetical protein